MHLSDYISSFKAAGSINPEQEDNVKKILSLCERFHDEAGIEFSKPEVTENTVVIESGHQPNYLPHAGTWKKPFLGSYLSYRIPGSLFLYGYADQNLSTAKILSLNSLPAGTKTGSLSIGYKIPETDRWKTFESLSKPSGEDFEKELAKIKDHYRGSILFLEEEMRESYKRAKNLSDYNSFLFARILSRHFGVRAYFFRYSDVQKEALFAPQWSRILEDLPRYNALYNSVVLREKIAGIHAVEEGITPFWLHCPCKTKVQMRLTAGNLSGTCPACKTQHSFRTGELPEYMHVMSPAAVSRNIIFAEGLGTSIYLSGAGGGLRYGRISDYISSELGYNLPHTLAWTGHEYFLGPVQRAFLRDLARNACTDAYSDKEALDQALRRRRAELDEGVNSTQDKKTIQKYAGQKKTLEQMLSTAKEMFSQTHSFLDQIVSLGPETIIPVWTDALKSAEIKKNGGASVIITDQIFAAGADRVIRNLSSEL